MNICAKFYHLTSCRSPDLCKHTYIHTYRHTHINTFIYIHIYIYISVYIYERNYVCACVCLSVCLYVYKSYAERHIYIYIYIYLYIYERKNVCLYVCMSVCVSVYKVMLNGRSSDGKIWHKCSLTIQKFNQAGVLEIDQPFGLGGPKCAGRWKKMVKNLDISEIKYFNPIINFRNESIKVDLLIINNS